MRLRPLSAVPLLVALAACQHATPRAEPPPATAAAATVPADDNLNAVLWMQRSVEYRAIAEEVYRAATERLDAALADPSWDALVPAERANPARGLEPAVIVDIDETVLDNSPYQARLVRSGGEYSRAGWSAWVAERRARAIPGAVAFARAAAAKGVTMIYLSNRAADTKQDTLANLRAVGLPVADDSVFLGAGTPVEGCTTNGSEKDCRRQLVGRRYRVLMQVGDQLGDFVKVGNNSAAAHAALYAAHRAWFGQRWWVLPNPSYGGWESAAQGDGKATREARRAHKRDALDDAK